MYRLISALKNSGNVHGILRLPFVCSLPQCADSAQRGAHNRGRCKAASTLKKQLQNIDKRNILVYAISRKPVGKATVGIWVAAAEWWRHYEKVSRYYRIKVLPNATTPPCEAKAHTGYTRFFGCFFRCECCRFSAAYFFEKECERHGRRQ